MSGRNHAPDGAERSERKHLLVEIDDVLKLLQTWSIAADATTKGIGRVQRA